MCSEYPDTAIKIKDINETWALNLFIVKFGIELYNNGFMNLQQLEYISAFFLFLYISAFFLFLAMKSPRSMRSLGGRTRERL